MKKFVIILLVLCLLLGCGIGWFSSRGGSGENAVPAPISEPAESEAPAQSAAPAEGAEESAGTSFDTRSVDYDAIRALYAPDEIVGDVDGREVSWEEYSYWLSDMGKQAEEYIATLAMYGQSLGWDDKLSAESEQTLAEYVVQLAQDCVRQLDTVETIAEENGVSLSEEDEAALAAQLQSDIVSACGEGASEADFDAYLEENHIGRAMYERLGRVNYLFQNTFSALYGQDGADVPEADAIAFLRENSYLCASHILFMTIDPATHEALDDDTIAQKMQQAEEVSAELRAIEDPAERAQRFAELKEQYCEDSGKTSFPEGYLFTPGTMVTEFEDAVKALGEYEVSEPVLSPYGYHVIMCLPLSAEMTMDYSEAGTPLTARSIYANTKYNELVSGRIDESVLTLRDDVAAFDLKDYLK